MTAKSKNLRIKLENGESVSAILQSGSEDKALLVLAHGAGAGMQHKFMEALAVALAEKQIATLRFQFIYMEKGSKRPDRPPLAHIALKGAIDRAKSISAEKDLPLFAGGKSFGGRMLSQLMAAESDDQIQGLVFFGFPLHPAGKPGIERAEHLQEVRHPLLFLQGTRDILATENLIEDVCQKLKNAELIKIDGADHSFHMLKSAGISDEKVIEDLATHCDHWTLKVSDKF